MYVHIFPSAYETATYHIFPVLMRPPLAIFPVLMRPPLAIFSSAYETASCYIFPVLMRPPLLIFFPRYSFEFGDWHPFI